MKKYDISQLIRLFALPVLTVVVGLVLLLSPDTASSLIGKMLAWLCIAVGLIRGAGILTNRTQKTNSNLVWTLITLVAGVFMLLNPLMIAKFLGRVMGLTLALRGSQGIARHLNIQGGKPQFTRPLVIAVATVILGVVLILVPMATTRVVFSVVGIVLIGFGVAELMERLQGRKLLDNGDDPNIIDVEKL